MRFRHIGLLASFLVVGACTGGSSHSLGPVQPSSVSTARPADPNVPPVRPRDATDSARMLNAFLDATYTQRAAGGWYRGGGQQSLDGVTVGFEVLVRASTAAEALAFCPEIASAAAYFFGNFEYRLTLSGRIDVPIGGGVTFKDATFAPVACNAVPTATDAVRTTIPKDATAAAARLASFLDDYLRQYEWFIGAIRDFDAHSAQRVTISTSGNQATAASRCATVRPFVTWFVGTLPVRMVIAPENSNRVSC